MIFASASIALWVCLPRLCCFAVPFLLCFACAVCVVVLCLCSGCLLAVLGLGCVLVAACLCCLTLHLAALWFCPGFVVFCRQGFCCAVGVYLACPLGSLCQLIMACAVLMLSLHCASSLSLSLSLSFSLFFVCLILFGHLLP